MASYTKPDEGAPLEGGDGTIDDLKQALVENLEHRGVLGKLRAKVRAEVFHTLEGSQEGLLPPPLSNENLLINELVRDYLSFNGYTNALSVFMAESGQPNDRSLDRAFIREELGLVERQDIGAKRSTKPLPLLYGITNALKRRRSEACSRGEEGEDGDDANGWGTIEETETHTGVAIGTSGKTNDDYRGIKWADPAPFLFTKSTRGGNSGSGDGGGGGGRRA